MNITRLTQARSLFPGQRGYQRQWVRSVRLLGPSGCWPYQGDTYEQYRLRLAQAPDCP